MNRPEFYTIGQVEGFMLSIPKFGAVGRNAANFSLDRMKEFCQRMGNPQDKVPLIHVAGTNGKGTTCQMLASVYQQAGYKTGLYTSPHLMDVRERFRIDGVNIDDEFLLQFFQEYGDFVVSEKVTFFELTTAIAFWFFADQKTDLAIIETGLGGKLDATNVIDPMISVITSIGMDHTDILGDSIEQIAGEKAGIIKQNRPVVAGKLKPKAAAVIEQAAEEKSSKLFWADSLSPELKNHQFILSEKSKKLSVDANGRKEIDKFNIAMSRLVVNQLNNTFPVTDEDFVKGIEQVDQRFSHHAHFEKVHPDRHWYFDGAHNIESVEILTKELTRIAPPEEWTVVLSFMQDKLNTRIADLWRPFGQIYLYEQAGERAAKLENMLKHFSEGKTLDQKSFKDFLSSETLKRELVIFSGSFYFYSIVRHWMGTDADK